MLLRLDGKGPRYTQIIRALSGLIQSGEVAPGTRLPSSRELARDLSCSRNLVLLAYEQLTLEGYLTPRGGAGTFVSPELSVAAPREERARAAGPTRPPALSKRGRRIAEIAARTMAAYRRPDSIENDFMYGLCEPDARMVGVLRRAVVSAIEQAPFDYPPAAGDELLRQQIALRLRTRRGIDCAPEQILVTTGTQQALDICTRLLVDEGDCVLVEQSTYDGATTVFGAAGARLRRVPVDNQGLVVSALPVRGPKPRLVYVTPSHQFPTGTVLSSARRHALLAWAKARGTYIFEDDYDSEFRYSGPAIAALAALDRDRTVIYSSTFAKSIFSSLRLGYLLLPRELVRAARACKWLSDRGSPSVLQRMVGELMASGEYDRYIRRRLRSYRRRRDALLAAFRIHLGSAAQIEGADAGLHMVVRLRDLSYPQLEPLIARCRERGVNIFAEVGGPAVDAGPRQAHSRQRRGLLVGYGLLPVERVDPAVRTLAAVYRELVARPLVGTRRASRRSRSRAASNSS